MRQEYEPAPRGARRRIGPFQVAPIGYGAMRLTGPNVFGPPPNRDEAVLLLREAVDTGVDHIDTAEYYGPHVVNELIREALHPYPTDLVLVSKVGARRDDRGGIFAYDEPAQLRHGIEENLRTLGIDSLPVVNLRLMRGSPPDAFFEDQLAAMTAARNDGMIDAIGLSNVTLPHLLHALELTDIECVQNAYHLADRRSQPVLEECAQRGIAFVPFSPLGSDARGAGSALDREVDQHVAARRVARPRRWHWPGPSTLPRTSCSSPAPHRERIFARTWAPRRSGWMLKRFATSPHASPTSPPTGGPPDQRSRGSST